MSDFEADISKWCDAAESDLDRFVIALGQRLVYEVQIRTPVMVGNLRSSIRIIGDIDQAIETGRIVIGTNVEYARRIEYGFVGRDTLGRLYNQKGVGMFTQVIDNVDGIAAEVLAEIRQ